MTAHKDRKKTYTNTKRGIV